MSNMEFIGKKIKFKESTTIYKIENIQIGRIKWSPDGPFKTEILLNFKKNGKVNNFWLYSFDEFLYMIKHGDIVFIDPFSPIIEDFKFKF